MVNPPLLFPALRSTTLRVASIALAVAWIYSPAIHGGFVRDDPWEIARNPELRLPAADLWKIWTAPAGIDYLPLKTTVQWIGWHLWGNDTLGYHLANAALHFASALILWRLLRRLGAGDRAAWLAGLLFAVHPLAVDSVAWISELKNTLSLPFTLLSLLAYVAYDETRLRRDYCRALACFLAAMFCKGSGAMIPWVLLLYCWWRRGRVTRADVLGSIPFFAVSLALGCTTYWFQQYRALQGGDPGLGGIGSRAAVAGLAMAFYTAKFFVPIRLSPVYPRWPMDAPSLEQFLPWAVLAALAFWFWRARATWGKHALFGLGFFVANLAPVLGFVPMSYFKTAWVANHLAYLPMVGLVGLVAAGLSVLERTEGPPGRFPRRLVLWICAIPALAALARESRSYDGAFRSEEALWTHTLGVYPESWIAHNDLALALAESGRMPDALWHFEQAVKFAPDALKARYDFANALAHAVRLPDAIRQYREALRIDPEFPDAHNNLGIALARSGNLREAEFEFERALQLNPKSAEARRNLDLTLRALGRTP